MNAKFSLSLDLQIASDDPGIPPQDEIRTWVALAAASGGASSHRNVEVAVRIVEAEEIHALNRRYRLQDKVTNVLSFPAGEMEGLPEQTSLLLGDIVICASVVGAEAAEQGKSLADHWGHMLVHGTLHLLGFDHNTDTGAVEMEALEARLLATKGITDPYRAT